MAGALVASTRPDVSEWLDLGHGLRCTGEVHHCGAARAGRGLQPPLHPTHPRTHRGMEHTQVDAPVVPLIVAI